MGRLIRPLLLLFLPLFALAACATRLPAGLGSRWRSRPWLPGPFQEQLKFEW
jgi:hypothetical protein